MKCLFLGDLYFAALGQNDSYPSGAGSPEYQCQVLIGSEAQTVNQLYLGVELTADPKADVVVLYPTQGNGDRVKCVERTICRVTAIFGGL